MPDLTETAPTRLTLHTDWTAAGPVRRLLRTVDRYWDVFAFGLPPALLLSTALVIGRLRWSLRPGRS